MSAILATIGKQIPLEFQPLIVFLKWLVWSGGVNKFGIFLQHCWVREQEGHGESHRKVRRLRLARTQDQNRPGQRRKISIQIKIQVSIPLKEPIQVHDLSLFLKILHLNTGAQGADPGIRPISILKIHHLNSGLVRYLNYRFVSGCQWSGIWMVVWKLDLKSLFWSKFSSIQMVGQVTWHIFMPASL